LEVIKNAKLKNITINSIHQQNSVLAMRTSNWTVTKTLETLSVLFVFTGV